MSYREIQEDPWLFASDLLRNARPLRPASQQSTHSIILPSLLISGQYGSGLFSRKPSPLLHCGPLVHNDHF